MLFCFYRKYEMKAIEVDPMHTEYEEKEEKEMWSDMNFREEGGTTLRYLCIKSSYFPD